LIPVKPATVDSAGLSAGNGALSINAGGFGGHSAGKTIAS
jgi:hypothetical protein